MKPHIASTGGMIVAAVLLIPSTGCAPAIKRTAPPVALTDQAEIPGMPNVRFRGDIVDPRLQADILRSYRNNPMPGDVRSKKAPGMGGLVLSGGGDRGAFGAGLLCGWTERGDRPRFRFVTGVSTGALIAPLAFLGPKYDDVLREAYTTVSASDVIRRRILIRWLSFDSITDSTPLAMMLERQFPDELVREVAVEHAKGRRLYVQTMNLDSQRAVVWDMGAIASSGHPDAPRLFRQVLVASASIPSIFPPQYIQVRADGKTYQEMHVDGGTSSQMLMSTMPVNIPAIRSKLGRLPHRPTVYIIRNGYLRPEWEEVRPKILPIAARSLESLIKAQANMELHLMYQDAKAAGMNFHFTHIPDDYTRQSKKNFDTAEMNRLFDLGYQLALKGDHWHREPPKLLPPSG